MFKSVFLRRLFVPYLVLICVAMGAVGILAGLRLRARYMETFRQTMRDEARLVSGLIGEDLAAGRIERVGRVIGGLGEQVARRITVVGGDGAVVADNRPGEQSGQDFLKHPEVGAAMRDDEAAGPRGKEIIHDDALYIARRMTFDGGRVYYLLLAAPVDDLRKELRLLYGGLGAAAIFALVAGQAISRYFARRQAAPVVELTRLADAIAGGDFTRRTTLSGRNRGEIEALGYALNRMAESIQALLAAASKDKAELLAILSSMSEGVIATDEHQQIVVVNDAAAGMLGFLAADAVGKPLWQMVRIDWIIKATAEILASGNKKTFEAGLIRGRHLEICLVPYPAQGPRQGLVLVAHDATQAIRYQELRKEFVANVSHELRTPLTVIKGYVETLRDGAMADPERAADYLATIDRHATQLGNLVDDLLVVSRLESQGILPRKTRVDIAAVSRKAIELMTPSIEKKGHTLEQAIGPVPIILGNADYMERAVANLLENACKYTPEGGRLRLAVFTEGRGIAVEVSDNGIGIPEEDLPRIFERFYRVDRSRSREMGGTGLGLSIVKHIVQAHGGTVQVSGRPGQGSTFRFTIPIAPIESA